MLAHSHAAMPSVCVCVCVCLCVCVCVCAQVTLQDIRVTGPSTIEADWMLGGWLRQEYFPWGAKIDPIKGARTKPFLIQSALTPVL